MASIRQRRLIPLAYYNAVNLPDKPKHQPNRDDLNLTLKIPDSPVC